MLLFLTLNRQIFAGILQRLTKVIFGNFWSHSKLRTSFLNLLQSLSTITFRKLKLLNPRSDYLMVWFYFKESGQVSYIIISISKVIKKNASIKKGTIPSKYSPWWGRIEDVFGVTFFLSSKTSSRHLEGVLEDEKLLRKCLEKQEIFAGVMFARRNTFKVKRYGVLSDKKKWTASKRKIQYKMSKRHLQKI